MSHRSRLGEITIDCETEDLEGAASFWARALGVPCVRDEDTFRLEVGADEVQINIQKVDHPSWVHLDIETDDIEAEVRRLEALGAARVRRGKRWWVMASPTGHGFCVCRPARADFAEEANQWDSE